MVLEYDTNLKIGYIHLVDKPVTHSVEYEDCILDYNDKELVGIELLNLEISV
jgi:uncharacterized protein YuzE